MNKISRQKRQQLILVTLLTLTAVLGLWFFLIRHQQAVSRAFEDRKQKCEKKLAEIRETIKNSKQIEIDLVAVGNNLEYQERDMASGDYYASMVNTIRNFRNPHNVDIPQFTAGGTGDVKLLPKFPYKQFTVTISGTAYYFDLGKFVADFENQFPTSRILNLELSPVSGTAPEEKEKLAFKMDIVSLVKPGPAK